MHLDREWVWIISGVIAAFGTIAISELISIVIYPIIVLRYLYPSFIMIWILFAIDISKGKLGRLWTALLVAFIFMTCYPTYLDTIKSERANDRRLESTLTATTSEMDVNDLIYTDILHFAWTVADVYYPGTPISEEATGRLGEMDYEPELVVDCGYIGTGDVWVYKVVPKYRKGERWIMTALVGHTGFVGDNIYAAAGGQIQAVYNSKNIEGAYRTRPD